MNIFGVINELESNESEANFFGYVGEGSDWEISSWLIQFGSDGY